ncbi:hypothetical protein PP175_21290 [Aneurinibacillus sp. Ricciae_BoGa-3]|uniref:hypothetical protein n=1 Tax=Aneurinibacillus sp. Ricciae_BoGa-3 TaxID=3022697 RepID=UPI002340652E|nr:hypothetical protein [Aneurinibacillus sp. Ricciae_BoGa-3]WCK53826.1 hypothetical protein PP175_21290 [Aneurinibacillus sp. Ricciae_BoGa-3]
MNLQRYDLLFVKGKSLVSRTIEGVTHSLYSHVAIVLDEWHIAETDWRVPLQVKHIHYTPTEYDVFRYSGELTFAQMDAMDTFLHEKLNTRYDTVQALSNGLYLLTGLPIRDAPDKMDCSETAARMYEAAGINLAAFSCTPGELAKVINLKIIS